MSFDAGDKLGQLVGILARYVVLSRVQPGCRNIDLCYSQTKVGRIVIIEKWDSPDAQKRHFDSDTMVQMAKSCTALLATRPGIDLLGGISAQDLE